MLLAGEAGVGFLPWLVRAVVRGFEEVPSMNAHLDAQRREVVLYERVDLGIAVQTDAGLVVPVLRNATEGTLIELETRIAELADGARLGKLSPADMRGGTFTITSAGKLGGLFTTPLLNLPEVGILGLHRAEDRAVVRNGEIVIRRHGQRVGDVRPPCARRHRSLTLPTDRDRRAAGACLAGVAASSARGNSTEIQVKVSIATDWWN